MNLKQKDELLEDSIYKWRNRISVVPTGLTLSIQLMDIYFLSSTSWFFFASVIMIKPIVSLY